LSQLEAAFIALLTSEHLPIPQTNRPKGSYYVDCRWPQHNLTVELDSYRYHNSRQSWERDRQREREARARGDEFRRYTWNDVFAQPRPMLQDLSRLLA
jgi:very-short-patch-repair endonuclease